jgi:hypothetical protein
VMRRRRSSAAFTRFSGRADGPQASAREYLGRGTLTS